MCRSFDRGNIAPIECRLRYNDMITLCHRLVRTNNDKIRRGRQGDINKISSCGPSRELTDQHCNVVVYIYCSRSVPIIKSRPKLWFVYNGQVGAPRKFCANKGDEEGYLKPLNIQDAAGKETEAVLEKIWDAEDSLGPFTNSNSSGSGISWSLSGISSIP